MRTVPIGPVLLPVGVCSYVCVTISKLLPALVSVWGCLGSVTMFLPCLCPHVHVSVSLCPGTCAHTSLSLSQSAGPGLHACFHPQSLRPGWSGVLASRAPVSKP